CRSPPPSPLFPYTTLFRSAGVADPSQQLEQQLRLPCAQPRDRLLFRLHQRRLGPQQKSPPLRGRLQRVLAPVARIASPDDVARRSEEHTSELQSLRHLVCR